MPGLRLGFRDHFVCLPQFLQIVDAGLERIHVDLARADPQHVQNKLCILRALLVLSVVKRLACLCRCNVANQSHFAPREHPVCQHSVTAADRFKADNDWLPDRSKSIDEAIIVCLCRHHGHPPAPATPGPLD
jgi:hypothetical protein